MNLEMENFDINAKLSNIKRMISRQENEDIKLEVNRINMLLNQGYNN